MVGLNVVVIVSVIVIVGVIVSVIVIVGVIVSVMGAWRCRQTPRQICCPTKGDWSAPKKEVGSLYKLMLKVSHLSNRPAGKGTLVKASRKA